MDTGQPRPARQRQGRRPCLLGSPSYPWASRLTLSCGADPGLSLFPHIEMARLLSAPGSGEWLVDTTCWAPRAKTQSARATDTTASGAVRATRLDAWTLIDAREELCHPVADRLSNSARMEMGLRASSYPPLRFRLLSMPIALQGAASCLPSQTSREFLGCHPTISESRCPWSCCRELGNSGLSLACPDFACTP